jgi:hypothetical protein
LAARIPPAIHAPHELRAHIMAHRNTSKTAVFFAAVGDEYARRKRSLFLELAVSCGDRQGKARVEGRSELGPALLNRGADSTRELERRMLPYCWPRAQGVTGEGLGCARKKRLALKGAAAAAEAHTDARSFDSSGAVAGQIHRKLRRIDDAAPLLQARYAAAAVSGCSHFNAGDFSTMVYWGSLLKK